MVKINTTWASAANPFEDHNFEQLFNDLYEPLCLHAIRFTRNPEAAEDIVQEVFAYIWEHRKRLKPVISMKAYLYTAVKNRALNYLRKYPLRKTSLEPEEQEEGYLPDPLPDPHQLLQNKELSEILHKAIESLPERCRIIFSLKKFEGMSHREIAETLQISEKTIEAQITIAGKKLILFLARYLKTGILILLPFLNF